MHPYTISRRILTCTVTQTNFTRITGQLSKYCSKINPMTKNEFLLNLQNGRRQWQQTWKGIDLFGTSRPRTPGELSLRDILYHVAWYEREMVEMIQLRTLVGSPWWVLPVDERNTHVKTEGETVSLLQSWRLITHCWHRFRPCAMRSSKMPGFSKRCPQTGSHGR